MAAIEAALEQLPEDAVAQEILLRGDSAACVHAVADFCREGRIRFSVGHDISAPVREAIAVVPDGAWVGAIGQDGVPVAEHPSRPRKAYLTELTEHLDLSAWPEGSRLICRRERAHPGAQLSLVDTDGRRHTCFLTDQQGDDIAELDRDHRAHAHVEQRSEDSKALGPGQETWWPPAESSTPCPCRRVSPPAPEDSTATPCRPLLRGSPQCRRN